MSAPDRRDERCPLCGEPQHTTKAEYLACTTSRRKRFAELDAAVAKLATQKKAKT